MIDTVSGVACSSMSDDDYNRVVKIVFSLTGIVLGQEKKNMAIARLMKRVRSLGLNSVSEYVDLLEKGGLPHEDKALISVITTNYTSFFREKHHFEFLRKVVFPEFVRAPGGMRIWSAGCSTGQEPVSILLEMAGGDFGVERLCGSLMATDIDEAVLEKARQGRYNSEDVYAIPAVYKRYFDFSSNAATLKAELRRRISYLRVNLHDDWPESDLWHVVFCRNVAIYFDKKSQCRMWSRFLDRMHVGGYLFIGHSERIPESIEGRVSSVGRTVYKKIC